MTPMTPASVLLLFALSANTARANDVNIADLAGPWCLRSLAATLDGERTADNSSYEFTQAGKLNYQMGAFRQSGDYTVKDGTISTTGMGTYDIVALDKRRMTLLYGGAYFFFEKGSCN